MFLIISDNDFLTECGFLKSDFNRLFRELKNISIEQNEDFLHYFKNQEESNIEMIFQKNKSNNILLRCLKMLDVRYCRYCYYRSQIVIF